MKIFTDYFTKCFYYYIIIGMKNEISKLDIVDIKKILSEERPANWEEIPDIDLYMDQIVGYMKRQHIGLKVNENLTGAMVNNYVKQKVMPKANGKKYTREHIAYLTAICLLKQILPVKDVGALLCSQTKDENISDFYKKYTEILGEKLTDINEKIDDELTRDEAAELALEFAVSGYVHTFACECLVNFVAKED